MPAPADAAPERRKADGARWRCPRCQVAACDFNRDGGCGAPGITLGDHGGHADCLTARF